MSKILKYKVKVLTREAKVMDEQINYLNSQLEEMKTIFARMGEAITRLEKVDSEALPLGFTQNQIENED